MTTWRTLVKRSVERLNNHYRPLDATWSVEKADARVGGYNIRHVRASGGESQVYYASDLREVYGFLTGVEHGAHLVFKRIDQKPLTYGRNASERLHNEMRSLEARKEMA